MKDKGFWAGLGLNDPTMIFILTLTGFVIYMRSQNVNPFSVSDVLNKVNSSLK